MTNLLAKNNDIPSGFKLVHILRGHRDWVGRIAWSPEGHLLASGSGDQTIRIWDVKTGETLHILSGHSAYISSLTWSSDGELLASGSQGNSVGMWKAKAGKLVQFLEGHKSSVNSIAWSPTSSVFASGSYDRSLRFWESKTGNLLHVVETGHTLPILDIEWSLDSRQLISASQDKTIKVWDTKTHKLILTFSGHTGPVFSVARMPNYKALIASSSDDHTIRLWNIENGQQLRVLEGHTDGITCISFSNDGHLMASKSLDNTIRLWDCSMWETIAVLPESTAGNIWLLGLAFSPVETTLLATVNGRNILIWELDLEAFSKPTLSSLHYLNAKVVLVGESGVGKTALGTRLAEGSFRAPESSTHGAQFWQISLAKDRLPVDKVSENVQTEVTLWDLAGQAEYHLIHQLFLDDVDLALLLFDGSKAKEPFPGVDYWAKVLKKHLPERAKKYLIAARHDVSPVTVDQREINRKLVDYGLDGFLRTSAKTGEGVDDLLNLVLDNIPWDQLPSTSTLALFQVIREYLLECKSAGHVLVSVEDVLDEATQRYTERTPTTQEVAGLVGLLQTRGLVYRLDPSPAISLVLLRPELINQYASSIIQAARNNPRGFGTIAEREVVTANFPILGFERLKVVEEKLVLESTIELLIRHDLCFREMGELIFPSQISVMRPKPDNGQPRAEVTYEFSGAIEAIYASLVVRLNHTAYFRRQDQWRYAAEFSRNGGRLGFAMRPSQQEGTGELGIYFYPGVNEFDRVTFIRFVTDHLRTKGIDIRERIHLYCPECKEEVTNRRAIRSRVRAGKLDIPCQYCGASVIIPQSIEELYQSNPAYSQKQQELAQQATQRTQQEVANFKENQQQYTADENDLLHILHLSDIHLETPEQAKVYRTQLEADLKKELNVNRLEYLVITGDIAAHAASEEYDAAFDLINGLVSRFGLDAGRVILVPGTHDIDETLSKKAYVFTYNDEVPVTLPESDYIPAGPSGVLMRDDAHYLQRFGPFSEFYKRVCGEAYPLNPAKQGRLFVRPEDRVLFLALNSVWKVDHHFQERAGVNMEALSTGLEPLFEDEYPDFLKVAVWHHPVAGREMMDDAFLDQLTVHGFHLCLHGHLHEARESFHKYDDHRGLHIVGAGTFGAPVEGQKSGIPLQYNLLELNARTGELTVKTRCKDKANGAWRADARWGDKNEPKPYYTIELPISRTMVEVLPLPDATAEPESVSELEAVDYRGASRAHLRGISPNLYGRLRASLLKCESFNSNTSLHTLFSNDRVAQWRNSLPQARSREQRVEILVDYLFNKTTRTDENALLLFLQVLIDQLSPQDALHTELQTLTRELETGLKRTSAFNITYTIPSNLAYADFEIRILPHQETGYPVELTLYGQQQVRGVLFSDDLIPWSSSGDLLADGQRLFEILFADARLRSFWERARGQTKQRRIRLWIDEAAPELHALPWEYLLEDNVALAANANTPFSRYLPSIRPVERTIVTLPVRILAVVSNPHNLTEYALSPFDVAAEQALLEEALNGSLDAMIQLDFLSPPVTLERLESALRDSYDIVYYVGYGAYSSRRQQSALYLQDTAGNTQIVTDEGFASIFARQVATPCLIFLATSQSTNRFTADAYAGLAPRLVHTGIPMVIAMQGDVSIIARKRLIHKFFQRLMAHGIVDLALNEARNTLLAANSQETRFPLLFARLRDGRIFDTTTSKRSISEKKSSNSSYISTSAPVSQISYASLDIRISPHRAEVYSVEMIFDGQQQFRGMSTMDIFPWIPSGDPQQDGHQLFAMLSNSPTLQRAWATINAQMQPYRIQLWIDPDAAELYTLPWELLQEDNNFFSTNANTPFSRHLPSSHLIQDSMTELPLRMLAITSNPDDLELYGLHPLDVAAQQALLEEALSESLNSVIQLDFLPPPVTLAALESALHDFYHIVYYFGYGDYSRRRQQTRLFFQDKVGSTQLVTDEDLASIFAHQFIAPHLFFCATDQSIGHSATDAYAGLAPRLASLGVPMVIGMQDMMAITDIGKLTGSFFQRLMQHGIVDLALNEARSTLLTIGSPSFASPVLFMQSKDGKLFDV